MSDATSTTPSSSELPPDVVQEIAQSVATMIAARTPDPSVRPQVRLETPGGSVMLGEGLAGSFTLAILYNTTTYRLTVTIPTGPTATYEFKLVEEPAEGDPVELASFTYTASDNWSVKVSVPQIEVNPTFKIGPITLALSDTPPPPPV